MQKERKANHQFNNLLSFDNSNNILVTKVIDIILPKSLKSREKHLNLVAIDDNNKYSGTVPLSLFDAAILHIHTYIFQLDLQHQQ